MKERERGREREGGREKGREREGEGEGEGEYIVENYTINIVQCRYQKVY